ncbi:MAG: peptidylprolyl isomerase [Coprothermobacterota bacterium]|nr:peptidylprolyl isomerase [Coprothermobacterota bacterium]
MSKKQKARKQAELAQKKKVHQRGHARISAYETRVKMIGVVLAVAVVLIAVVVTVWGSYRGSVLAYVGTETITRDQVNQLFSQQASRLQQQGMEITEGSEEYKMLWDSSLEATIQERLALKEAGRLGIIPTAAQIQEEVTKTASQYQMTEDQFKQALAQQNLTWESVLQDFATQLQRQQIYEKMTGTVTVNEDEVKTAFEEQRKSYDAPAQAGVRFLFLNNVSTLNGGRTEDQTLARGEEALAKIKEGTSFGDVVTQYSDDKESRDKLGDLGTITPSSQVGKFGEAFDQAVFTSTIPLGEVSGLVPIKNGFGIFQVYSRTPSYTAQMSDRWNFTFQQITTDTPSQAQAALDLVKTGTTFAEVAMTTSTDTVTGANGGDMGTVNRKSLKDWQLEALDSLALGEVSSIVSDGNQFYLIKLNEVQTLQAFIQSTILDKKKNEAWSAFIEELKAKIKVTTV